MRHKDLALLEYEKFLDKLCQFTHNKITKNKIKKLTPYKDINIIKSKIDTTKKFLHIYERENFFPLTEFPDITNHIKLLSIQESTLSASEIYDIKIILDISKDIKKFLQNKSESLDNFYKKLFTSRETKKIIEDSIDEGGFIKDTASRELLKIRKDIKQTERKITSILESILHNPKYEDILQEKLITIRKNRYVIPVKENFSSKLKGIIHDRSSTGHTIFLEPINIVELNNKISDLKIKEQIEIRKILKFLTDILRSKLIPIKQTFETIIELDFLLSVAKYAVKTNSVFPELSQEINLKQAKHPLFLLLDKHFNPIDITITQSKKGLVITGPNTGGKTIALKTTGILALLVQTGIPVPVDEESCIPVFDGVYADIGDFQSIEANLSTYSWHISNIKDILERATSKSLVLLDELVAGTDPDEAGAIGIGILKYLKERNSYVVATSHLKQIKLFSLSDSYFEVASVGFNKDSLMPTYTLHYHTIGQSFAFYIAKKLGLKSSILKEAKKYLNEDVIKLDEAIKQLEQLKSYYDEESKKVSQLKYDLEQQKQKYEQLNKELENLKKEKWKKSIKEIENFVKDIKKEGYSIIQKIKENPSGKAIEDFSRKVKSSIDEINFIEEEDYIQHIEIGDKVKIKGKNTVGEVISVRETKANVNFNGVKIWIPIKDLEKIDISKNIEKKTKFYIKKSKISLKPEINLIGLTKEEAIKQLESFLDKAILAGYTNLRIIHGYGSGILRKAVREYLDNCPYNLDYKDADYNEGGMGATIVEIK